MKKILNTFLCCILFFNVQAQQNTQSNEDLFFVNQFRSIVKLYSNKEELDKTFKNNLANWVAQHKLDDKGKFYVTDYLYFYHAYIGRWESIDIELNTARMKKFAALIKKHLSDLVFAKFEEEERVVFYLKSAGSSSFHATFEIEPNGSLGLMIMY